MGKITIKRKMVKTPSLSVNLLKIKSLYKRALFLSSGKSKAGMALEGSLVLPIFLFFMMTVLLSLEVVRFQSQVQEALFQAGTKSAFSGYQIKYAGREREDVKHQVREYLDSQLYPYLCIRKNISWQNLSIASEGRVLYQVSYTLKPFISWLPIGELKINDRFVGHMWTGYTGAQTGEISGEEEIYVYITDTGSRYHLSHDCAYLRVKVQAVNYEMIDSLRNQSGGKYYACAKCRPLKGGIVYITAGGSSFHRDADCSALKRTVYIIPLKEAEKYSPCSKCVE